MAADAIHNEVMPDVDDQLIMMHSVHGPILRLVSIEHQRMVYRDEQVQLFGLVARHVRAALHRAVPMPLSGAPGSSGLEAGDATGPRRPGLAVAPLTPRQHQVMRLVADGLSDQQNCQPFRHQ